MKKLVLVLLIISLTFSFIGCMAGADGANGVDGKDGINGIDGEDGKDGKDGADGKDGVDGTDGKDGINGADGKDGIDGTDGKDGADGKDGIDGTDGKDGTDGSNGKSAYELACDAGFKGTEAEWLASLKGTDGTNGRGIDHMAFNENGELVVYYTDGTTQNLGYVPSAPQILEYKLLADGTYEVYAGNEIAGYQSVTIPSTYRGRNVSGIAEGGFSNVSTLISVYIPETITTIGASAFENCTSLETVLGGEKLQCIGNSAFANCTSLQSFTISSSCVEIGNSCFDGATNLTVTVYPASLSKIGSRALRSVKDIIWESDGSTSWQFTVASGNAWIYPYLPGDSGQKQYTTVSNQTFKITINKDNATTFFKEEQNYITTVEYNYYWGNYKLTVSPGSYVLTLV